MIPTTPSGVYSTLASAFRDQGWVFLGLHPHLDVLSGRAKRGNGGEHLEVGVLAAAMAEILRNRLDYLLFVLEHQRCHPLQAIDTNRSTGKSVGLVSGAL